jgi:hypothetical protein
MKNISPISETRSLMQDARPTTLNKGEKKKAPLPPKIDISRMNRDELNQSRKTVEGGFISTKNAQPVAFVKQYKRKGSLGRKPSQLSGFKHDGLREIYIDSSLKFNKTLLMKRKSTQKPCKENLLTIWVLHQVSRASSQTICSNLSSLVNQFKSSGLHAQSFTFFLN